MSEECEKDCIFFDALAHINESLAHLNRTAREVVRKGGEFDGSAGSMCGSCVARGKIVTALREEEANA